MVESGGRSSAVNVNRHLAGSASIDVGLMQINSAWLPKLARHGVTAADLRDPCTSIEVGAWILSGLVQRLGDTWEAVGAYNAGCTELKGSACTKARSSYAWRVYRRMQHAQGTNSSAPGSATSRPRVAAAPSPSPAVPSGPRSLTATAHLDRFTFQDQDHEASQ